MSRQERQNCSVHVEQLFYRNGDGRVVWVDLHDVGHHVPPFLCDGIYVGGVLTVGVLAAFLVSEEKVGLLVPEDAVVAHTGFLDHLFQFRPDGGMTFGVLFSQPGFRYILNANLFIMVLFLLSCNRRVDNVIGRVDVHTAFQVHSSFINDEVCHFVVLLAYCKNSNSMIIGHWVIVRFFGNRVQKNLLGSCLSKRNEV